MPNITKEINHTEFIMIEKIFTSKRESTIEILRILSMLMILIQHIVVNNRDFLYTQEISIKKIAFLFPGSFGNIGVGIFFIITAWFLSMDNTSSLKKSFSRIWALEREVLFYSLFLCIISFIFLRSDLSPATIFKSILPTMSGLWWYITAYVITLIFMPFLTKALKLLGRDMHRKLCITILIMWGLCYGVAPFLGLWGRLGLNAVELIFLYILISYYRWYINSWTRKTGWTLFAIGVIWIFAVMIIACILTDVTGHVLFMNVYHSYTRTFTLPSLLVEFGLILVCTNPKREHHSRIVNAIAGSALSAYLVTEYPATRT